MKNFFSKSVKFLPVANTLPESEASKVNETLGSNESGTKPLKALFQQTLGVRV